MADAKLDIVSLHDDEGSLQADFVPGAGMLCCSLRDHGGELLAQNAGVAAYAEHGKTMGIPLLYPWANRLAGFQYSAAGHTVQVPHDSDRVALDGNGLPIHGVIGGRMQWELTDGRSGEANRDSSAEETAHDGQGEEANHHKAGAEANHDKDGAEANEDSQRDGNQLEARLSWSRAQPELFEVFPFRHDVCFRARLDDRCLLVEVTVQACGQDRVPVAFGFHPYLTLPGTQRERWLIELPAMCRLALDAQQIPTGADRRLAAERFELAEREYDDGFDELSQPARFAATAGARRLELDFEEGYPCGQVYSPRDAQFICFEPMTAPANALCSGSGLRTLAPGERYRAAFTLHVTQPA